MYEMSCQSRFDAQYWMLGAGVPEVTGTSRGNPEFPEVTRERLGESLIQRLLMPDSPTMTPEQGRAPLAT